MKIVLMAAGIVAAGLGMAVLVKGMRIQQQVDRYEFDNGGPGGGVGFKDFDASRAHYRKQVRARFVQGLGLAIAVVGAFVFAFGLVAH